MKRSLFALAVLTLLACAAPRTAAAIDSGTHIDFVLQFDHTADNRESFSDGYGLWVTYRHDWVPDFSIGASLGWHQFTICRCNIGTGEDTVTAVPLLITARFDLPLLGPFTVFGQVSGGVSFNFVSGGTEQAFHENIDPSPSFDGQLGALYAFLPNMSGGVLVDVFVSDANLYSNTNQLPNHVNLGHEGIGFIFEISF
ncbi:MAG: hypothetical protein ACREJ2_06025 [Planctomycetota bacterium]